MVQRRIDTTPKDLSRLRSRFRGPLTGQSTFDKIVSAVKAYHARDSKTPELPLVMVIGGLTREWLEKNSEGKSGQKRAKSGTDKARWAAVMHLNMEASRQWAILSAEKVYATQTTGGDLKALSTGPQGAEGMGLPIAEKVVTGASTGAMAFGIGKEAEGVAARYKLSSAELAAIRVFTLGDYGYINPAIAQDRGWMLGQNTGAGELTDPDEAAKAAGGGDAGFHGPETKAVAAARAGAEARIKTWMEEGQLHAGIMMKAAEKLPVWRGVTFRGFRSRPADAAQELQVGKKLPFGKTFASTSVSRETANKFATGKGGNVPPAADRTASVLVMLTLRNGRDIQALSAAAPGEREILVLAGSEFTIRSVTKHDSGDDGSPSATDWYTVSAVQTDAAATKASPDVGVGDKAEKAKTTGGTELPEDALGQVALSEAQKAIEAAVTVEPGITTALREVAAAKGGKLAGLENKFKTEPSLARKLADRARTRVKGDNVQEAVEAELAKVYDALRYTVIVPEKTYTAFATADLRQALQAKNAVLVNYWDAWAGSNTYKGINQAYSVKSAGYPPQDVAFEVQIHTSASFKTKTDIHEMYEEARLPSTSGERRKELDAAMAAKWKKVPTPAGMTKNGTK